MTTPQLILFHPRGSIGAGSCEALGCGRPARLTYPTDRRVCGPHLLRVIGRGFWGCGCGPEACPACARHLALGKRVLLVGERENRPGWPGNDLQHLADVQGAAGGAQALHFLERAGALRWGSSRGRLLRLGLRWDNAVNLLGPSGRSGSWNAGVARKVVHAIREEVGRQYGVVVLLGSKVREAWAGEAPGPHTVWLPHPSGRNRLWNDPKTSEASRELVEAIYRS